MVNREGIGKKVRELKFYGISWTFQEKVFPQRDWRSCINGDPLKELPFPHSTKTSAASGKTKEEQMI